MKGAGSGTEDAVPISGGLSEVEIDLDLQSDIDRFTVAHSGPESPLTDRLYSLVIETVSQAACHSNHFDCAVSPDNRFQDNRAFIFGFTRFLRVFGQHLREKRRRCHTATNTENSTPKTATLSFADAWTASFTDTASLPGANATAHSGPSRWRAWNAVKRSQHG